SRYNVFEYEYPGSNAPPGGGSPNPSFPMGITPAMGPQDELTPFQRSLQSENGSAGASTTSPVPFLDPRDRNPLGGGMGGWSASATHPSLGGMPVAPSPTDFVNSRFGSFNPANVAPLSPAVFGLPDEPDSSRSNFEDVFAHWIKSRAPSPTDGVNGRFGNV